MAPPDLDLSSNVPEYSVGELSGALKRTIEDAYGFVRVRGEVSKWFVARSGHAYLTLKDETAVLEAVCWKARVGRLSFQPEEGLEVVCTGRLTTFPGRSQYQLVVDDVTPHGVGALLAQLEERKQRLAAEGLFAQERKRPLPFLPEVVGVVTSPTGAVIRDILHRLADRFPRPVLVWPVTVQGERCAPEVTAAIQGFARLPETGWPRRPDVLIVARGGGSIEDLWGFNDEALVRAAATSPIPLVSAVGHETDTTLIDLAADVRAPTPTAAAELVVPVASLLRERIAKDARRLEAGTRQRLVSATDRLKALARALPQADALLANLTQRVDQAGERLPRAATRRLEAEGRRLLTAAYRLRTPTDVLKAAEQRLAVAARSLDAGLARRIERRQLTLTPLARRLEPSHARALADRRRQLQALAARLDSLGYQRTLARGYALVRDGDGRLVARKAEALGHARLSVEFVDGRLDVGPLQPTRRVRQTKPTPPKQGTLL
ncbi:MAG: exodeoxyribonuclease VII large subunit [Geminicoccaceae bacterium]|nr:MAG: exodeoxyribonuclease VII large subunit [Geminicoccaceae bacterium]